jgi:hypothetical protein
MRVIGVVGMPERGKGEFSRIAQEMAIFFNIDGYRKQHLVKNDFFVMKRMFGSDLKSRISAIRKKEIDNKMIVCNLAGFYLLSSMIFFYRAVKKNVRGLLRYQDCQPAF